MPLRSVKCTIRTRLSPAQGEGTRERGGRAVKKVRYIPKPPV